VALPAVAELEPLVMVNVADGIYVHAGHQENASIANHGDIANIGFVVGSKCVAVIDTGGTAQVGRALHAAVRKVTSLPICYVINTHVHPDHIFGNAAFKSDDAVQFVGHMKLPAAMAARGKNYLHALERDLEEAANGTELIPPRLSVEDAMTLDLGDRTLALRAWPTAHTDNDLTVYDQKTATLWLSDLLFVERIPVVDGSVRGWLAIIQQLRSLKPSHVIPGHGRVDPPWPQVLDAEERYLGLLVSEVRSAIKADRTIQQAVDTVGLAEHDKWLLSDSFHRRNVTAVFAELEWED
jgi:quinoprotein relay system zinc metallohydrolase 2